MFERVYVLSDGDELIHSRDLKTQQFMSWPVFLKYR